MVTFTDLRHVAPSTFRQAAATWLTMASDLGDRAAEVRRVVDRLATWEGAAADAAKTQFVSRATFLDEAKNTLFSASQLWEQAADRIDAAQALIGAGLAEVEYWSLTVAADGTVHDDHSHTRMADEPVRIREIIARNSQVFRWAVADATTTDTEIAAALRRCTPEALGLAPDADSTTVASSAIPATGTDPVAVKTWWDSLTPMQQESLLFSSPGAIGMLDGIPVVARDRANRFLLAEERAQLEAERAQLLSRPYHADELAVIDGKLHGIRGIEDRLNKPEPGQQQAYLLGIDSAGSGRAIVAIGNPDTATNVATFVPGTGASLASSGTDIERADKMDDLAERQSSPSTAIITWVGYDAPQDIVDAGSESYAQDARHSLDRFQDGLRATHEGAPSHNTVVGHSYGSTVIGHTARDLGLNADDVVFVGSPGVGVNHVSELNLPQDSVHATVADNDIINLTNPDVVREGFDVHGRDPAGQDFGARSFESAPGTPGLILGYSTEAHSEYWDRGNPALKTMGAIIAGNR